MHLDRIARLLHVIEATSRVSRLMVNEMIVNTFPSRTDNQIHALVDAQGRPLRPGERHRLRSGLALGFIPRLNAARRQGLRCRRIARANIPRPNCSPDKNSSHAVARYESPLETVKALMAYNCELETQILALAHRYPGFVAISYDPTPPVLA